MSAPKLVPAIRRIAERATKADEVAILALLDLCERQHAALKALEDVQGFMMIGHPGSRHDKAFVGCVICESLAAGRAAGLP